jgi:hypothetical protein
VQTDFDSDLLAARQEAIHAGALKPQGIIEQFAANNLSYSQGIQWQNTELAQQRLREWTRANLQKRGYNV